MCDPMTLVAVQGVAAAGGVGQQIMSGRALEKHQANVHAQGMKLAAESAQRNYAALGRQRMEHSEAAGEEIRSVSARARAAAAAGRVSASSAGVVGSTVGRLLDDFERQSLTNQQFAERREGFRTTQFTLDSQGIQAQQSSNQLSTLPQPANYPSWASGALQVGAAGASAFGSLYGYNKDTGWTAKSN